MHLLSTCIYMWKSYPNEASRYHRKLVVLSYSSKKRLRKSQEVDMGRLILSHKLKLPPTKVCLSCPTSNNNSTEMCYQWEELHFIRCTILYFERSGNVIFLLWMNDAEDFAAQGCDGTINSFCRKDLHFAKSVLGRYFDL